MRSIVEPIDLPPTIIDLAEKPLPFETIEELPGQPAIAKRLQLSSHPTRHPLHDEGAFYSLDYSSVFAASVILATPKNPDVILDVCAAPGGKSVFAWKALRPQVLLSNEIVQGRAKALISNLKRCHVTPVRVFSAGPDQLALRLPQACDLVLLDVPCSGQSLMVKGQTVTGSFMPHAVSGNVKR
ncbi:MAG TPA: hypothetical protein VFV50_14395, partial [Bdellovibrionales bacterium]|nr:hypothetical protein [Bdellovibrionales bacterium]